MRSRRVRTLLLPAACLAIPIGLRAQEFKPLVQLRATRSINDDSRAITGDKMGGGVSFGVTVGDTPLKPRLRLDYDDMTGRDGGTTLGSVGVGLEAVLNLSSDKAFGPVFSAGPVLQRWRMGGVDAFGEPRNETTRLAFRAEAGIAYDQALMLTAGCLYGKVNQNLNATIAYVAFTLQF